MTPGACSGDAMVCVYRETSRNSRSGFVVWMKSIPLHSARHLSRQREHRCMVTGGFIEAGYQMITTRAGGAGTDPEPARQLRLARSGQCRTFFVTHSDPFDVTASYRIGERVQRVA